MFYALDTTLLGKFHLAQIGKKKGRFLRESALGTNWKMSIPRLLL